MRLIHQRSPRPYRQVAAGKGWRNGPALPCLACFSALPCFHYACLLLCTCPACFHGSCLPCLSAFPFFYCTFLLSCFLCICLTFFSALALPASQCFACLSVLCLPLSACPPFTAQVLPSGGASLILPWRRSHSSLAQVSSFAGAGHPLRWRRSDFLAGTCATVLHRMAKCGAGPDLFCRPAPAGDVADLR